MAETDTEALMALKALERDTERMIRYYMSLQDKADGINEEIYNTCCGIEELNVQIAAMREQLGAKPKSKAPSSGRIRPSAGGRGSRIGKSQPPLNGTSSG